MHLQSLTPAAQAVAMAPARTPTPFELFSHQARVLHDFDLCSASELEFVAANHVPTSTYGPFLYIPSCVGRRVELVPELLQYVASGRGGSGRMGLKHEPSHADVPVGGYFVTGFAEIGLSDKVSAAQCDETFARDKRYGLTVLEVGFLLLYFPTMFDKASLFAAVGSTIKRVDENTKKDEQVPLWHLRDDKTVALDSYYRTHQSAHTVFPSCEARVDAYRCH